MNFFEKEDPRFQLFEELGKANDTTFLGHSIKTILGNCSSKDDFDWLVTQLKDYVNDTPENLCKIIGKEACVLIDNFKPFIK